MKRVLKPLLMISTLAGVLLLLGGSILIAQGANKTEKLTLATTFATKEDAAMTICDILANRGFTIEKSTKSKVVAIPGAPHGHDGKGPAQGEGMRGNPPSGERPQGMGGGRNGGGMGGPGGGMSGNMGGQGRGMNGGMGGPEMGGPRDGGMMGGAPPQMEMASSENLTAKISKKGGQIVVTLSYKSPKESPSRLRLLEEIGGMIPGGNGPRMKP